MPKAAFTVVHNRDTMEREFSLHGVAYYGSNWHVEHECYTADQMRAYAAACVAAERERCALELYGLKMSPARDEWEHNFNAGIDAAYRALKRGPNAPPTAAPQSPAP